VDASVALKWFLPEVQAMRPFASFGTTTSYSRRTSSGLSLAIFSGRSGEKKRLPYVGVSPA